jgi:hypothetical protein
MTPNDVFLQAIRVWVGATFPQAPEGQQGRAAALAATYLSPEGREVVRFLADNGSARGGQIGRAVGDVKRGQAGPKLRALLKELLDRGVLIHDSTNGYALSPAVRPLLPLLLHSSEPRGPPQT